jgi:hypothetical protein
LERNETAAINKYLAVGGIIKLELFFAATESGVNSLSAVAADLPYLRLVISIVMPNGIQVPIKLIYEWPAGGYRQHYQSDAGQMVQLHH